MGLKETQSYINFNDTVLFPTTNHREKEQAKPSSGFLPGDTPQGPNQPNNQLESINSKKKEKLGAYLATLECVVLQFSSFSTIIAGCVMCCKLRITRGQSTCEPINRKSNLHPLSSAHRTPHNVHSSERTKEREANAMPYVRQKMEIPRKHCFSHSNEASSCPRTHPLPQRDHLSLSPLARNIV